ncbi:MAG: RsmD family RNA methyltransferase, partial [Caldisphaera sp.]|nr:RsmD family RNA methyltransferase [Caldisphaera sp.]
MIGNLKVLIEKEIPKITNPKRELEQYSTPSELILDMIQDSYLSGLLENSITMDLGAGTCRIAIASLLMGALKSIALEIDDRFYHDCMGSVKKFNLEGRLIFIKTYVNKNLGLIKEGSIDIIFMNPPFGIW